MLRTLLIVGLLALSCAMPAKADTLSALQGRYVITPSSRIVFSVAQIGGGGIEGIFSHFSGTFDLDPGNIARSSVSFSLEPESVATGEKRVENFLRSSAVFDVTAYPVITFRSTTIEQDGSDTAQVKGMLTARGITRSETFKVTLIDRQGRNVAFHVVGDLMRSSYGMDVGTPIYSNITHFDMVLHGQRT